MKNIHKSRIYSKIKKAAAIGAVMIGLLGTSVTAYAANAAEGFWKQDERGWWVQFQDGSYARQMWISDGISWYAFDDNGYMITGWWWIDGDWYYFDPNGAMHTGWLQDADGTWYLLDDGGAMRTGWCEVSGAWHYLYSNGAMAADTWVDNQYLDASGVWNEGAVRQGDFSEEIAGAIENLRTKYPDGLYWNHVGYDAPGDYSSIVTGIPCNHLQNGLLYCNSYILGNVRGYQCDGFARKLSDEVFGSAAGRTEYEYSFDKVKVGDYLRYSSTKDAFVPEGHSVFVIGKTQDSLIVVESNNGGTCKICWDTELSREYLDSIYAECFTRY